MWAVGAEVECCEDAAVQEAVRDLKREGNHGGKQPFVAVAEEKKKKKKRK